MRIRVWPLVALVAACHRAVVVGSPTLTSLEGVVMVTGSSFDTRFELQHDNRVTRLLASGSDSAALVRLSGVTVAARGAVSDRGMQVTSFTALNVAGAPVVDGVVRVNGTAVSLETANGNVKLGNPPDVLRRMAGARIWVSGPIDTGPNSYGVIVPPQ